MRFLLPPTPESDLLRDPENSLLPGEGGLSEPVVVRFLRHDFNTLGGPFDKEGGFAPGMIAPCGGLGEVQLVCLDAGEVDADGTLNVTPEALRRPKGPLSRLNGGDGDGDGDGTLERAIVVFVDSPTL